MGISIGSNIASLRAQRSMNYLDRKKNTIYQQLSSGERINRARDDAAGLAISEVLKRDTRVANVAIRNANDGISLLNIADASLSSIQNVLMRMAELAEQAANGVYSNFQRSALELEVLALGSEIERIATVTNFNNLNLLSNAATINIQVGFDSQSTSRIVVGGVSGTLASLALADEGSSKLNHTVLGDTNEEAQINARTLLAAAKDAIEQVSSKRGEMGVSSNRMESAIGHLAASRESFTSSLSKIKDVDIAQATAELSRMQILQNATAAVLAQANLQPSLALNLLR